jgi:hypothetical protein
MPYIMYEKKRFTKPVQKQIDQANAIIAEYAAKGFALTLRSLYYQFVARKLVERNTIQEYKRLGDTLSKARIAGLVDWYSIGDNTRYMREMGFQDDPWIPASDQKWSETDKYLPFLKGAADSWNVDMWKNQKVRPLVLIEKDALIGVIEGVCNELEVPYFACRGYMSQSAQWRLGMTLRGWKKDGYEPIIFHLGDHDPSGMDMTRDNETRLWMFGGFAVEFNRLALNMDQVEEHNPPPMPAKKGDSRTGKYKESFGNDVWELDALDPTITESLIRDNVLAIRDQEAWDARVEERDQQRSEIKALVDTLAPKGPPEPRDVYQWYGVPEDD